jgi:hypothetical protein
VTIVALDGTYPHAVRQVFLLFLKKYAPEAAIFIDLDEVFEEFPREIIS